MALRENTFYDTVTIAVVIDDTATTAVVLTNSRIDLQLYYSRRFLHSIDNIILLVLCVWAKQIFGFRKTPRNVLNFAMLLARGP